MLIGIRGNNMSKTIFVLSDSIGETAEAVARAVVSQFEKEIIDIVRIPYVNTEKQIDEALEETAEKDGVLCHTIVSEGLRHHIEKKASEIGVVAIDILGPMLEAVERMAETRPRLTPGMVHKLDQEYFKKVEAIEFAVKYDDGKNPLGFLQADIVLIGVSRTSKTPLSMYLAYKKIKAANLPLVPEVPIPKELFTVSSKKIVGLIIDPFKLNSIRSERLRAMGLGGNASYADLNRISEELEYAKAIMRKIHCPILDVSAKSIEETATAIMEIVARNKAQDVS